MRFASLLDGQEDIILELVEKSCMQAQEKLFVLQLETYREWAGIKSIQKVGKGGTESTT